MLTIRQCNNNNNNNTIPIYNHMPLARPRIPQQQRFHPCTSRTQSTNANISISISIIPTSRSQACTGTINLCSHTTTINRLP